MCIIFTIVYYYIIIHNFKEAILLRIDICFGHKSRIKIRRKKKNNKTEGNIILDDNEEWHKIKCYKNCCNKALQKLLWGIIIDGNIPLA